MESEAFIAVDLNEEEHSPFCVTDVTKGISEIRELEKLFNGWKRSDSEQSYQVFQR